MRLVASLSDLEYHFKKLMLAGLMLSRGQPIGVGGFGNRRQRSSILSAQMDKFSLLQVSREYFRVFKLVESLRFRIAIVT